MTLAEIETAIETVINKGQFLSSEGYTYRRADLAELRRMKQSLIAEDVQGTASSVFDRGFIATKRR